MLDPMSPLGVGETGPEFTLPSTAGTDVTLSEDYDQFVGTDTIVLPISVDSVPTLTEYPAPLDDKFYSSRAYFFIDKQGVVRWRHTETKLGDRRDDVELLRVIRSL